MYKRQDQSHDTAGPAVPPMHADGVNMEEDEEAPCSETRHMADTAKVRNFPTLSHPQKAPKNMQGLTPLCRIDI